MSKTKIEIDEKDVETIEKGVKGALLLAPLAIVGWFALLPILLLVDGVLFSKIWEWWVSDTFGIQKITIVQAAGLSTIVAYYRFTRHNSKTPFKDIASNLVKDLLTFALA